MSNNKYFFQTTHQGKNKKRKLKVKIDASDFAHTWYLK